MTGGSRSTVRSLLVNRTVAWVFGILVVFVLVLQAILLLKLDPFANLLVRVALLPGYIVMLSYTVLLVNLYPGSENIGQFGWLLGFAIYLYFVSVTIAGIYRMVRRTQS